MDESWLNQTRFVRRIWVPSDAAGTIRDKQVQPRISMIVGLDTEGTVYMSALQANSNSSIMEMFFVQLLEVLDRKNKNWRKNTIILMDSAPYHVSSAMKEFYKKNHMPIMLTGPHSYDASPIELFYAAFKSVDINPAKLATGRK